MKRFVKPLLLVSMALLLICSAYFTTLAFLTDETGSVLNTFALGDVVITLDETELDEFGEPTGNRTYIGNQYKLVPGTSYVKDPTIHVDPNSVNSLLFVAIENTANSADPAYPNAVTYEMEDVSGELTVDGETASWKVFKQEGDTTIYYLEKPVLPGSDVLIFNGFKFAPEISDMQPYVDSYVAITAYALQADGFFLDGDGQLQDPEAAWMAFPENQSLQ